MLQIKDPAAMIPRDHAPSLFENSHIIYSLNFLLYAKYPKQLLMDFIVCYCQM